jgi:acyl carrier protein
MEPTYRKLKRVIAKNFFVKQENIGLKKSLKRDLRISTWEFPAMIAYIENAFQIEFLDNEIKNIDSVAQMVAQIDQHLYLKK